MKIYVKENGNGAVCKEENARRYITDPEWIEESAYYLRLIADGDLVVVAEPKKAKEPKASSDK